MIYQLRVLIRGVSPMIWRCILVRCDSTLAELHSVLQAVFDWSGECLHCFCIHGKEYGSTADADRRIARLSDFRLHCGERFVYRYNFCSGWECEVRLQATIPAEEGQGYPLCAGGKRAAPPEMCPGPWAYLELLDHHKYHPPVDEMDIVVDAVERVLETRDLTALGDREELREAMERLEEYTLFQPDRFERRQVNHRLRELAQACEGGRS